MQSPQSPQVDPNDLESDELFVLADRQCDQRQPPATPVWQRFHFLFPLVLFAGLLLTMILGVTTVAADVGADSSDQVLEVQRALAERRASLLQNCVVLFAALLGASTVYSVMEQKRSS